MLPTMFYILMHMIESYILNLWPFSYLLVNYYTQVLKVLILGRGYNELFEWKFWFSNVNDFFLTILTWMKLHTWIHFDRKRIFSWNCDIKTTTSNECHGRLISEEFTSKNNKMSKIGHSLFTSHAAIFRRGRGSHIHHRSTEIHRIPGQFINKLQNSSCQKSLWI